MVTLFGGLLELKDDQNLEDLVKAMDNTLAIKFLEMALENCTDKFTLVENHVIYKCLQKIKNDNKTTDLRNVHSDGNTD